MWTADRVSKELRPLLMDALDGRLSLFVGDGVGRMSGLPSWAELVSPLALEVDRDPDEDPLQTAAWFVKAGEGGADRLSQHLLNRLQTEAHPHLFDLLKCLPASRIVTTSTATLLEGVFDLEPRRGYKTIECDKDLDELGRATSETLVIRLGGRPDEVSTIPLASDVLASFPDSNPRLWALLVESFALGSVMFLGTEEDPIFERFEERLLPELRNPACRLYGLSPGAVSGATIGRGLTPIDLGISEDEDWAGPTSQFLSTFWRALKKSPASTSPPEIDHGGHLGAAAKEASRLRTKRLGTGLSLEVDPDHVDSVHRYLLLHRQDLLDYETGDFYSIRRIRGKNESGRQSPWLLYSESSEKKVRFSDTGTRAYETASHRRLMVEPLEKATEAYFTHAFRIHFPVPVEDGQEFDIVYAIRLPGELRELSSTDESMSISLTRIEKTVERLEFNVCLNFEPQSVEVEGFDWDRGTCPIKGPSPVIAPYKPASWYETDLDIKWSMPPTRVSWACEAPQLALYKIHYRVLPEEDRQ